MKKFLLTLLASLSLLTATGTLFALPTFAEGEDTAKTTWLQISPTAVSLTLEAGQDINPGDDACPNEIDAGCAVEVTNSGTQPCTFRRKGAMSSGLSVLKYSSASDEDKAWSRSSK